MTLDYSVIIPMTITVALSYGVRRMLSEESIYTLKLVRRGHRIPDALQTDFHGQQRAKDLMSTRFAVVPPSSTLQELSSSASPTASALYYLVEDPPLDRVNVAGVLSREEVLRVAAHGGQAVTISEIADRNYITVAGDAMLRDVIARMHANGATVALVVHTVRGLFRCVR
jgi:CIC family chloride channel protein